MKRTAAFTRIELLLVIAVTALLGVLSVAAFKFIEMEGNQATGVHNCKQIILALQQFAKDHGHQYPDSVTNKFTGGTSPTSNDAFRFLIQEQIVKDEHIFGCPDGFKPDGNIGAAPRYSKALEPDENHWALTAGQTDTGVGSMPLVFENPVSNSWAPYWNADVCARSGLGRVWPGALIIVGRNDGSVGMEKMSGEHGLVSPKPLIDGLDIFTQASSGQPQRVLNITLPSVYRGCPIGPITPAFRPEMPGVPVRVPSLGQPGGLPPSPLGNP
ncbi:type II secretion system protein [Prosthecobacter sp.]|uniref:type II secretion system protein n=1 Tax=Prosthecobacter sp. TaxID=1965333 RepID=UPI002AB98362|nr:type II secretion system protein [Prosthecobacter sp.]MDZ4401832.1 type II secretion system protein [Prosthecobacter sp.]